MVAEMLQNESLCDIKICFYSIKTNFYSIKYISMISKYIFVQSKQICVKKIRFYYITFFHPYFYVI